MSGVKFPVFWDLKTSETFYWHYKYAQIINPLNLAGIYMLKVNNKNFRTRCEICSKLTIKTPERRQWHGSGVFIINFEHISHLVLLFLLLFLNM